MVKKIKSFLPQRHRGTEVLATNNANNTKVKSVLSLQGRIFMDSLKPNICVFCVIIPGLLPFTLWAALRAFNNFPEIYVAVKAVPTHVPEHLLPMCPV